MQSSSHGSCPSTSPDDGPARPPPRRGRPLVPRVPAGHPRRRWELGLPPIPETGPPWSSPTSAPTRWSCPGGKPTSSWQRSSAAQLDVDTQANKRVFVYYVENVKSKELAATLTEIFGKPGDTTIRPERRRPGAVSGSRRSAACRGPASPRGRGRNRERSRAERGRGPGQGRRRRAQQCADHHDVPAQLAADRGHDPEARPDPEAGADRGPGGGGGADRREPPRPRVDAPDPARREDQRHALQRRLGVAPGRGPALGPARTDADRDPAGHARAGASGRRG